MIVNENNACVKGDRFNVTLEEVEEWLSAMDNIEAAIHSIDQLEAEGITF